MRFSRCLMIILSALLVATLNTYTNAADVKYIATVNNIVRPIVVPEGREDLIKPEWGFSNLINAATMNEVPDNGWLYTPPNRYDNPAPPAGYSAEYIVNDVRTRIPIGTIPTAGVNEKAEFVDGSWILKYNYHGKYVTLQEARTLKIAEIDSSFKSMIDTGVICSVGGTDYKMAADDSDAILLKHAIELTELNGLSTLTITDFYDEDHLVSVADAKSINLLQANFYALKRQNRNNLRALVRTATLAELDSITW